MKKLTPLFLAFFLSTLAHANEMCELNVDDTVDQLAADGCEVTDKLNSCAQKEPDPDALKKKIEGLLNFSQEKQDQITKYWKNYEKSSVGQMFEYDARYAQSNRSYVPTHILDWFTNSGKASVDRDALKNKMVENYVKFAQKNECTPIVKHRYTVHHYPDNYKTDKQSELQAMMQAPDYESKKDAYFDESNKRSIDSGSYCEKGHANTRGYTFVAQEYPPCSGNVSGLYKDNEWSTSTLDNKLSSSATGEVVTCIKDRLAKGAKIHHISVVSSASALNNTGAAAAKFCKKGFLELSKARAESARDKVLPQLFSQAGQGEFDYSSKVVLNFNGSNGDGTSGPCPYTLKNGVEVLKDEFRTPAGKKVLDDDKFVKIHVTFEAQTKKVNDSKTYYSASYSCRNIYYECAPVAASTEQ